MPSSQMVEFYKENGYVKLENIFSPEEIEEISQEYDELFTRKQSRALESQWGGQEMKKAAKNEEVKVLSIHNLQFHSAVFTRLITNWKLLDALEQIMGTPNVLLHHTKAHLKPPEKGAPYLMHQDYHYFPFKNHSMVAAFLHLDDSSPENGGLCVYPGSHKLGPLEDKGVVDKGEAFHYVDPEKYPISGATSVTAKKGDIIVFSYLLLHGSYLNKSERPRRMFLLQVIYVTEIFGPSARSTFDIVILFSGLIHGERGTHIATLQAAGWPELMSAEDEPLEDVHKSPAQGLVLRGRNVHRDASMVNRFVH